MIVDLTLTKVERREIKRWVDFFNYQPEPGGLIEQLAAVQSVLDELAKKYWVRPEPQPPGKICPVCASIDIEEGERICKRCQASPEPKAWTDEDGVCNYIPTSGSALKREGEAMTGPLVIGRGVLYPGRSNDS